MSPRLSERFFRDASEVDLVLVAQNGPNAERSRAEDELLRRSEPTIQKIVAGLYARRAHRDDALQGGRIGFLTAIRSYDSSKGASLSTFAHMHIRGGALRELYAAMGRRQDGTARFDEVSLGILEDATDGKTVGEGVRRIVRAPSAHDDFEKLSPWGIGGLEGQVMTLPPRLQDLLTALYRDDLSMADAARVQGTSRAAVSQRHATAMRQLRRHTNVA